jgi:hypothetical protein
MYKFLKRFSRTQCASTETLFFKADLVSYSFLSSVVRDGFMKILTNLNKRSYSISGRT